MRLFIFLALLTTGAAAQIREFEVASIKRSQSGPDAYQPLRCTGSSCTGASTHVANVIQAAYATAERDIIGPSWILAASLERYDITAKLPEGTTPADRQGMLQHLLATRFALKVHQETRERPVYLLVKRDESGALGPNLRPAEKDCRPRLVCEGALGSAGIGKPLKGSQWSVVVDQIVRGVREVSDRQVLDRTGLSGAFDFQLEYARSSVTDGPAADIFAAVQQLGLQLESSRAPFLVLVVDSIDRPTAD